MVTYESSSQSSQNPSTITKIKNVMMALRFLVHFASVLTFDLQGHFG